MEQEQFGYLILGPSLGKIEIFVMQKDIKIVERKISGKCKLCYDGSFLLVSAKEYK